VQIAHASLVVPEDIGGIHAIVVRYTASLFLAHSLSAVQRFTRCRPSSGGGDTVVALVITGTKDVDIDSGFIVIASLAAHSRFAGDGPHTRRKHKFVSAELCAIFRLVAPSDLETHAISGTILAIATIRGRLALWR
jgi:hypothetical protein